MGMEIRIVKNVLHLVPDESTGKWDLKYSADGGTTWTSFLTIDYVNNSIELFPNLEDDVTLKFGSDTDFSMKYDSSADTWVLRDEINSVNILEIGKNGIIKSIKNIADDVALMFGDDNDFKIKYNSTTDTLQILDASDNVVGEFVKL